MLFKPEADNNPKIKKLMITDSPISNEQLSAAAFTRQSVAFDEIYAHNTIVRYKRERVRAHIRKYLPVNSNILELNAGTGEDAIYFARESHTVHATDISDGMLNELVAKVKKNNLEGNITSEKCSFTELDSLENKGPFNLIFSKLCRP